MRWPWTNTADVVLHGNIDQGTHHETIRAIRLEYPDFKINVWIARPKQFDAFKQKVSIAIETAQAKKAQNTSKSLSEEVSFTPKSFAIPTDDRVTSRKKHKDAEPTTDVLRERAAADKRIEDKKINQQKEENRIENQRAQCKEVRLQTDKEAKNQMEILSQELRKQTIALKSGILVKMSPALFVRQ